MQAEAEKRTKADDEEEEVEEKEEEEEEEDIEAIIAEEFPVRRRPSFTRFTLLPSLLSNVKSIC